MRVREFISSAHHLGAMVVAEWDELAKEITYMRRFLLLVGRMKLALEDHALLLVAFPELVGVLEEMDETLQLLGPVLVRRAEVLDEMREAALALADAARGETEEV